MPFFIDAVKVSAEGQEFPGVFVSWDGVEPHAISIKQLAVELCMIPRFVIGEILLHEENQQALEQLGAQSVSFALKHRQDFLQRQQQLAHHFGAADDPGDDDSAAPQLSLHMQLHLLLELGMPFADFKLDFSQISGVLLRTISMDKAQWDQCRQSQSKLSTRNKDEVDTFQAALQALLPSLLTLEAQIAAAEKAIEAWRGGVGKPGLDALALLSVTHEMTAVYAQQDATAARLVASTQELVDLVGQEVSKEALAALRATIQPLLDTYKDRDFASKLLDYFEAWDPTHVYYFEAVAARGSSADAKNFIGFDKRLHKAIGRAGELMSQIDSHAAGIADELERAAQAAWQLTVVSGLSLKSRAERVKQSRDQLDKLFQDTDAGWVSIFLTWSGIATTAVGNMEGPPSILAIFLKHYSKGEAFGRQLRGGDGFLRAFVLIGVDPVERNAVLQLLKKDSATAQKTARDLFTNGSWRSPSVFYWFMGITIAMLYFHNNDRANKDPNTSTDELIKATLPAIQDLTNVLLIGLTKYYSKEMGAYLRSKGTANVDALANEINRLEKLTGAVKVARILSVGLTSVTLILSIWTIADDSVTSDKFEDRLLLGSVMGAALTFIGSFAASSLLGPAGVVVGFVVVLVAIGYQSWFKPKIASAMQSVSKNILADKFLLGQGSLKVKERAAFIIFTQDVSLSELVRETVEQLNDFPWQSKLDPKLLVDYSRAGLPASMVGQLYGLPEDEVRKRVRAARLTDRPRPAPNVTPIINLVRPANLLVNFEVGAVNDIKLEVQDPIGSRLPNNIWLEVAFPDPDSLLADFGKTPATSYRSEQVVMLFMESSTRFGRVYAGTFRLNFRPDNGKVSFEVFVPADKFATGPKPGLARATVTKELVIDVAP